MLYEREVFEHWAKEKCILPGSTFPVYRNFARANPWMRTPDRLRELTADSVESVFAEVAANGPLSPRTVSDQGRVGPVDLSGWKVTSKVATMALRLLTTRCRVVTAGRVGNLKLYDLPERALPSSAGIESAETFGRSTLLERVEASGLLSLKAGPWWSTLSGVRKSTLVEELVRDGVVELVQISGGKTLYLAPRGWRERFSRRDHEDDGKTRILAPLEPMIWNRELVSHIFGFDYVWEVYKPSAK
jgi:uncharacterized protein YcaQ